ncbi:hypothetical protein TWF281_003674 [Arthrobotrys megalospora]
MKENRFYRIVLTALLCLVGTALCAGGTATKTTRDLGWSNKITGGAEGIECILMVKQSKWKDREAHARIRSVLIKDLLGLDPDIEGVEDQSQGSLYIGQFDGVGTAFYIVYNEYKVIADVILGKLKDDLGAWLNAADELPIMFKMLDADDKTLESSRKPQKRSPTRSSENRIFPTSSIIRGHNISSHNRTGGSIWGNKKEIFKRIMAPTKDSNRKHFLDIQRLTTPPDGAFGRHPSQGEQEKSFKAYYNGNQGKGIDVYVLDSGFAPSARAHEAFSDAVKHDQFREWIIQGGLLPRPSDPIDWDFTGFHGTGVISKIVGKGTGLARRANVWVALFDSDTVEHYRHVLYIELLLKIRTAIMRRSLERPESKAIISMSLFMGVHRRKDRNELKAYSKFMTEGEMEFFHLLSVFADEALNKVLELKNIIVVTGTGNGGVGKPITNWPSKRGTKELSNLVVIGYADEKGQLGAHVEAEFVKVYGVSDNITIPLIESNARSKIEINKYEDEVRGISFAIPSVAGILATHLSDNPKWSPLQAVEKLYSDAYPLQKDSKIKVVWTGKQLNKRRQASEGGWPDPNDTEGGGGGGGGGGDGSGKTPPKKPRCSTKGRSVRRRQETWDDFEGDGGDDQKDCIEDEDTSSPDSDTESPGDDTKSRDEDTNQPGEITYYSTRTVAMHFTSVPVAPKTTRKPKPKPTTSKPKVPKPTNTKGWDGTKHAAIEMTSRRPPVGAFITPNPTPNVGNKDSMMEGLGAPNPKPVMNPAPRPGRLQKPVQDRRSMLLDDANISRGYTSKPYPGLKTPIHTRLVIVTAFRELPANKTLVSVNRTTKKSTSPITVSSNETSATGSMDVNVSTGTLTSKTIKSAKDRIKTSTKSEKTKETIIRSSTSLASTSSKSKLSGATGRVKAAAEESTVTMPARSSTTGPKDSSTMG